jgi:hypothetical protein
LGEDYLALAREVLDRLPTLRTASEAPIRLLFRRAGGGAYPPDPARPPPSVTLTSAGASR